LQATQRVRRGKSEAIATQRLNLCDGSIDQSNARILQGRGDWVENATDDAGAHSLSEKIFSDISAMAKLTSPRAVSLVRGRSSLRRAIINAAFALTTLSSCAPENSQQSQDWKLCIDESGINIERRIMACNAIIETPGATPRRLAKAYCARGSAYEHNRQIDRAIADYDQAVHYEPDVADQYLCRGNGYSARGEQDRAIGDYSQAIRIDPNYAPPYSNRGLAYYLKGDFDRAIADYDEAIRLEPTSHRYDYRGESYRAKGDLDRAITDYDKAIQLDSSYVPARYNRASAYAAKGDQDRAMVGLNEAVRLDPAGGYPFANRGRAYFFVAKYDAAASDFAQAEAAQPHYAINAIWLYLARARTGDHAAAAELQTNAKELKETDWPYPMIELFLGGRTPEAALAVATGPGQSCEAQFYVGEWYVLRRENKTALQAFEVARDTCVRTYFEYQGARAELSHLRQ
jgi:tetratricopeptide (TPR) repeat protein